MNLFKRLKMCIHDLETRRLPCTYGFSYLVLKDKFFVYDLAHQRIGWDNYDCSSSVNVSIKFGQDDYVNVGKLSVNSSPRNTNFGPMSPRSWNAQRESLGDETWNAQILCGVL